MVNGIRMNNDPTKSVVNDVSKSIALSADPVLKRAIEEKNESGEPSKEIRSIQECKTCNNRRYVDASDDLGVSFKTPTKLSPNEAATEVLNHEMEHYTRENDKANKEGKKILSNSIQLYTGICPECGKVYISGGVTRTTSASKREEDQAELFKRFFDETLGNSLPHKINTTI